MAAVAVSNSASVFEDSYPIGSQGSYFAGIDAVVSVAFNEIRRANKRMFQNLVVGRCSYLDSLKTLRPDWISGESVAPSLVAIDFAKKVLTDFSSWLELNKSNLPTPKMVMGPIPMGGISMEFIVENRFKIFLNIFNDKRTEMTVEHTLECLYIDIDTAENSVEYLLKKAYYHFNQ